MKDNDVIPGRNYLHTAPGDNMAFRVQVVRAEPGRRNRWRVRFLGGLPGQIPLERIVKASELDREQTSS